MGHLRVFSSHTRCAALQMAYAVCLSSVVVTPFSELSYHCATLQLKYVVTEVGSVRDPQVVQSIPQGIFDRAAIRAALRYKYKPLIRDGNAVEVEGVTQRITFVLEGEGKGPGYIPENCRGIQG